MDRDTSDQATPVLDSQELLSRCLGNIDFAERVLAKFQSRFDSDLEELEQAVLAQDAEHIMRVAHRIKGASANTAAHRLRQQAAGIEELARQQSVAQIPAHLQQLRAEWTRFAESASAIRSSSQSAS